MHFIDSNAQRWLDETPRTIPVALIQHFHDVLQKWIAALHVSRMLCAIPRSWKLLCSCMAYILPKSPPLSMFGMLWINVNGSMFQSLQIPRNSQQPITWLSLREGIVSNCMRPMLITPDTCWSTRSLLVFLSMFPWLPPLHPRKCSAPLNSRHAMSNFRCHMNAFQDKAAHFSLVFYYGHSKAHLCNNHADQNLNKSHLSGGSIILAG